jgi:hypothetical protein
MFDAFFMPAYLRSFGIVKRLTGVNEPSPAPTHASLIVMGSLCQPTLLTIQGNPCPLISAKSSQNIISQMAN